MSEEINKDNPPVVETPPENQPPAETPPAPEPSPEPQPPEGETPPVEDPPAPEPPKVDINYAEELNKLENGEIPAQPKPGQRSEEEKAKFTVDQIHKRFPHLKEQGDSEQVSDARVDEMQNLMLRNQVEGIIRANSKSEDEIKYKMYFYDKRIQPTGNIHIDAQSAEWLANEGRTRNAIEEAKRDPGDPGSGSGAGQKTPTNTAPELPPDEIQRLTEAGFKKVADGHWESPMSILKYDGKAKQWDHSRKA